MKGLELSRSYFEGCGRDALQQAFPDLIPRLAIGLAGEGSECFGFDDPLSRDHDWGPGFCIWMGQADYERYGIAVQQVYDSLPGAWDGYPPRRTLKESAGRVGAISIRQWMFRYTGCPAVPQTLEQWRRIPESFLACACNGAIFQDPSGQFTELRRHLQEDCPEDLRRKRISVRAAVMAQAGQYNYPRCCARGETVAAQLALAEFVKAGLSLVWLLNRRWAPFYKWMHRGIRDLTVLPRAWSLFQELSQAQMGPNQQELVERICLIVRAELRRQGLISQTGTAAAGDGFLLRDAEEIRAGIESPRLRNLHLMEE